MGQTHIDEYGKSLKQTTPSKFFVESGQDEDGKATGTYTIMLKKTGRRYADFSVKSLPGCCGVAVLSHVNTNWIPDTTKLIKTHQEIVEIAIAAAFKAKYGMLMATQRADSTVLPAYPATRGWEYASHFNNGKTNNDILALFLDLKQPKPAPTKPSIVTGTE